MSATASPEAVIPEHLPAPEPVYSCPNCSHWLPEGTLACPDCQTLAYGRHLNRLGLAAATAEREGRLQEARDLWNDALGWLPADATQAEQIRAHMDAIGSRQTAAENKRANWTRRLGPFAPAVFALAKFKSALFLLFKLKFFLGFIGFFGIYWALYGWKFALGFTLSILVHETGHYVAVRSRGLKADLPMFLPGLGAYVRWYNQGLPLNALAQIALAGPLFGLGAALVSLLLLAVTHDASFQAIAYAGAWVNLLNLIPVLGLDGAQATYALGRLQRCLMLAACVVLFVLMHEFVFLFIGLGMLWRCFTDDLPEQDSPGTLAGYLALLFLLGAFLYFIPNPGRLGY